MSTGQHGRLSPDVKVAVVCASIAAGMVGLAFASVPLYRMFCQATGFAGTPQRVIAPSTEVLEARVTVRFDANVAPGLPWEFTPVVNTMNLAVGENALAFYRATNRSTEAVVGTATFNVSPEQVGAFFNKVQCFCFNEQRLEPGESVEMPVSFYVDPAIVKDTDGAQVRQITLSYTFHAVPKPSAAAARATVPTGIPDIGAPAGNAPPG